MTTIHLFPNLGAEDPSFNWKEGCRTPTSRNLLQLWRQLFGPVDVKLASAAVTLDGSEKVDSSPAWPWLDHSEDACVSWYNNDQAAAWAKSLHLNLLGAQPGVVQRVHDKSFAVKTAKALGVDCALSMLTAVLDPDQMNDVKEIAAVVGAWPREYANKFTLKPRLGCSGKGRVPGFAGDSNTEEIHGALPRLRRAGGVIVEPWVQRICDFSSQWYVDEDGRLELLGTLEQILSESGSHIGHKGIVDRDGSASSTSIDSTRFVDAAQRLVERAAHEGYFGPCGVDGFIYRDPSTGATVLRPIVEFNARFSVGTVCVGLIRQHLCKSSSLALPASFEFRPSATPALVFYSNEEHGLC